MAAELLVGILNWNAPERSLACIDAVRRSVGVTPEIVVADNASTGGDAARLAALLGVERVLPLGGNLGYAGGMNAIVRHWLDRFAGTDHLLLLTPDATVEPEAIGRLLETMRRTPVAGVVGPMVVYRTRPARLLGVGGAIEPGRVRAPLLRRARSEAPHEVDWIDGCCMLLRRAAVEAVGGFDERFFAYFEETDFCLRARRAGWSVVVVPDAVVHHPKETLAFPPYYYYYMTRNRYLFWRENFGIGTARVGAVVGRSLIGSLGSWLESVAMPGLGPERGARWRRLARHVRGAVAGTRDHLRGRYGRMP